MVWFDFEIPQFFFDETRKQRINLNTGCVKNVTFQEVGSNFGIFKQALKNSPSGLFFEACLKILQLLPTS